MITTGSPFVEHGIDPLLADPANAIALQHIGPRHPARPDTQDFIGQAFRRSHGAEVSAFHPELLRFDIEGRLGAALGYRDAGAHDLFCEQYLDQPAQVLASARLGEMIERAEMVEVGNLAIDDPGQARWIISASTAFLAAAGYRWVLFTAIRPLANAFSRLGLKPLPLAVADPSRLPDRGAAWGRYYDGGPMVYLGDIHAGCRKLHGTVQRRPNLQRLLHAAQALGNDIAAERLVPVARAAGGRP